MSSPLSSRLFCLHVLLFLSFFHRFNSIRQFCTKTAYDGSFSPPELAARLSDDIYEVPNCTPIQLNMVIRHGTRYPSRKDILEINQLHSEIVKEGKIENLKKWKSSFAEDDTKALTKLGVKELAGIAERIRRRYPSIMRELRPTDVKATISHKQRTRESAAAFLEGLGVPNIEWKTNDTLIRPHDGCDSFKQYLDSNTTSAMLHEFFESEPFQRVLKSASQRAFDSEKLLTPKQLLLVFHHCAYETAILGQSSWCELLTLDDLHVLEYADDLKNYYRRAYGHSINHQVGCPLAEDIIRTMEIAVDKFPHGHSYSKLVLRFGHAETILPLLSGLTMFRDNETLRADNFHSMNERRFRTTRIVPFSANVALVLLDCGSHYSESEDIRVQLVVNERVEQLPFCDSLCTLSQFRAHLSHVTANCDMSQICQRSPHG